MRPVLKELERRTMPCTWGANKEKHKRKVVNIKRNVFFIAFTITLFIYVGLTLLSGDQSLSLLLRADSYLSHKKNIWRQALMLSDLSVLIPLSSFTFCLVDTTNSQSITQYRKKGEVPYSNISQEELPVLQ